MTQPLYYDDRDLFDRYYNVVFCYHESRSLMSNSDYSRRICDVPFIEQQQSRYSVQTQMTINMMLEQFRKRVTIRLPNYNDTVEIYEIIERHLVEARQTIMTSYNGLNRELLEDMVDLDRFASAVYDKAKSVFTAREREMISDNSFVGVEELNYFNIFNHKPAKKVDFVHISDDGKQHIQYTNLLEDKEVEVRERNKLDEFFIDSISRIGGVKRGR